MKISRNTYNFIIQTLLRYDRYILITLAILFHLFAYQNSKKTSTTHFPEMHVFLPLYSIAISELKYDTKPMQGYLAVQNKFQKTLNNASGKNGPDFKWIDKVIQESLNISISDVKSEGMHTAYGEHGLSYFIKISFILFGFQGLSMFYLCWSILILALTVFIITFYRDKNILYILVLYSISLYLAMQTSNVIILAIYRNRFFGIYTVLPAFYLILAMMGFIKNKYMFIVGTIIQAEILALLTMARSTNMYQLCYIFSITIAYLLYIFLKKGKKLYVKQACFILFPLLCYALSYYIVKTTREVQYAQAGMTTRGVFWHSLYMGILHGSNASEKYGMTGSDTDGVKIAKKNASKYGLYFNEDSILKLVYGKESVDEKQIIFCDLRYEKIIKDEFMKILKDDPWFIISAYQKKPLEYLKEYYNFSYGITPWVSSPLMILCVLILIITFPSNLIIKIFFIFISAFPFSLIPPMLYRPQADTIVDSSVYFTVINIFVFCLVSRKLLLICSMLKNKLSSWNILL